ncbi:2Fe-2S iron-sulfur cluster-binding protein [Nocardioides sp.]|uniref:2Fe-2S iron-sulfur cluster-binding protein n=1 Tax=Nocardioides sp. TaxID=35761 RepID=UPI003511E6C8
MTSITFTDHLGESRVVAANPGDTVMETAVRHGVPGIVAECGGSLSCATCHVIVDPAQADLLDPMDDMEDEMLYGAATERSATSRLSCQIRVGEVDLRVTTPETQV